MVTLVMPIYNAAGLLPQVLPPLRELPQDWQIILVDDGSSDASRDVAARLLERAEVLEQDRCGPAAARNRGALRARGEIVVFLDSDVLADPATLVAMADELQLRPQLTALFGAYSPAGAPGEPRLSRFRNFLHSCVHRHCPGPIASFWSALGAVRRQPFLAVGGFRPELFPDSAIEDMDLGARLTLEGGTVELIPRFQAVHLKRWNWRSMVETDVFRRALPWTRLGLHRLLPKNRLNLSWRFRLGPLTLAALLVGGPLGWLFPAYFLGNWTFCRDALRHGGWSLLMSSLPYLVAHHLCCLVGAALGVLAYGSDRLRGVDLKASQSLHHGTSRSHP